MAHADGSVYQVKRSVFMISGRAICVADNLPDLIVNPAQKSEAVVILDSRQGGNHQLILYQRVLRRLD